MLSTLKLFKNMGPRIVPIVKPNQYLARFFTPPSALHKNQLFDSCYRIIQEYHESDPNFWSNIKNQVDLLHKLNITKCPLTPEENWQIDFGPVLARNYDAPQDYKRMEPLYNLFNNHLYNFEAGIEEEMNVRCKL